MALNASRKDLASGAIFIAFGAFFVLEALNYQFGTPFRMGPGFMPVVLGGILVAIGVAVAIKGMTIGRDEAAPQWPWRGVLLVVGTIVFFAATLRGLGFIPTVLMGGFATAISSTRNTALSAVVISVGLCVLCVAIFVVGLGLIVPWFGPWLRFWG
jgi:hypothetical protein